LKLDECLHWQIVKLVFPENRLHTKEDFNSVKMPDADMLQLYSCSFDTAHAEHFPLDDNTIVVEESMQLCPTQVTWKLTLEPTANLLTALPQQASQGGNFAEAAKIKAYKSKVVATQQQNNP
jgi:hypothetical protein